MDSQISESKDKLRPIEKELSVSYLDYAMSVIVGRALPDVRDGFKPVHRRVLYSMQELSNTHEKPYKKSARIVGEVLGKYHPHGDNAIYDSLVRMAQDFSLRYTLVDGQGNFGSIDGDSAAAMRYTEVRMSKIANEMLTDIEKQTIDYLPNFDGTLQEPKVLPAKIPNLLINGSSGIAVGMATNMPPHNLVEVCDAMCALLENWDIDDHVLCNIVKGPDFPTGGLLLGRAGSMRAYTQGRGSIKLRAVAEIKESKKDKNRQCIVVTQIPYQVNKSDLVKNIAELAKDKRIEGITDIADYSDKDGIEIVIELKRGLDANVILNQLYSKTALEISFGIINLALVDNQPKTLTLRQLLVEFINHRREVIRRRCVFDLNVAKARKHILEGLKIALLDIDKIVASIKSAPDVSLARSQLMSGWNLSEKQASAILDMKLSRLTSLERDKIDEENIQLAKLIAELEQILADAKKIDSIIVAETTEIKNKYGDERKTKIIEWDGEPINDLDLIPDEPVAIILSEDDYIKRISLEEYRSQNRGGKGVIGTETKEEDRIKDILIAKTHDKLLIFTHDGMVHWLGVHEIMQTSRYSKGKAIVNLIATNDAKVSSCIAVRDFCANNSLIMATKNGTVKRTTLDAYSRPRKGGIRAITLRENDSLISVKKTSGNEDLLLATANGQSIKFNETQVREIGRTGQGVRGIYLHDGDYVVDMALCNNPTILTVCENGYGKRTSTSDYRLQNRGGSGTINIKTSQRNGDVVGVLAVSDEDEIIIFSSNNKAIRMPVNQISVLGRNTQGVRLMRLEESEKIVAIEHIHISDMNDSIPGATTTSNTITTPDSSSYTQEDSSMQLKPGMKVEVDEVEQADNQKDEKTASFDNRKPVLRSDFKNGENGNLKISSDDATLKIDNNNKSINSNGSNLDSANLEKIILSSDETTPSANNNGDELSSDTKVIPISTDSSDVNIQKSDSNDVDVPIISFTSDINSPNNNSKDESSLNSSTTTDNLNPPDVSAPLSESDLQDEPKPVTDIIEDEDDKRRLNEFFSKGKPKP